MKQLTDYIEEKLLKCHQQVDEKLVIFPSQVNEKLVIFPSQVNEKLVINKDYQDIAVTPNSFNELRSIIKHRSSENPKSIDLSDIDVSHVKEFVDLSGFSIFGGCSARTLEYIDVTGWDVSHITNFFELFGWFTNLKEIRGIEDWKISPTAITKRMFYNVPKDIIPSWYKS